MFFFKILVVITTLFVIFLNLWVIPSAITSGIKAISHDCDKTYRVEVVWNGNWFCPISEEK